jgi:aryl-alcohol dehydrogenase-like predicted oxidoreductase/predicted kinase
MRISTDPHGPSAELAGETIAAAAGAGITVFDTARAYGLGEADLGRNERFLAAALRRCGGGASARILTKGGMTRAGGGWVPDGRAKALRSDCEASLRDLDGLAIDLYLIHAPDPRTPWRTSVRALARLLDEGLVRRVGLSNVNRTQLDEALELAPIAAVQIALSVADDRALRGGILERCDELGIAVIAHSPLGGPARARTLARRPALAEVAAAHGVRAAEAALAWLLELSPVVVAIPGARRPETARSAAHAASLALSPEQSAALSRTFGAARRARHPGRPRDDAEVVLIMGIPGAGKTRVAERYAAQGYVRLNRDERGGRLRDLADALEDELSRGTRRVVLDNTYLTRAARSYVIEAAGRHRIPARCLWLSTSLAQAQVNLVQRLLERFGALPSPEELRGLSKREPSLLAPTSQMRAVRELEPPAPDEGFATVETMPWTPAAASKRATPGVFLAAAAIGRPGWERALEGGKPAAAHLVFDWRPGGAPDALDGCVAELEAVVSGTVQSAICPHAAGPPRCWCRPPLPGLVLAFARAHDLDPARSILIGAGPAHRTLATALGARYRTT